MFEIKIVKIKNLKLFKIHQNLEEALELIKKLKEENAQLKEENEYVFKQI